jgi:hypothetical protein
MAFVGLPGLHMVAGRKHLEAGSRCRRTEFDDFGNRELLVPEHEREHALAQSAHVVVGWTGGITRGRCVLTARHAGAERGRRCGGRGRPLQEIAANGGWCEKRFQLGCLSCWNM